MSGSVQQEEGPLRPWQRWENGVVSIVLLLMVVLPVYAVIVRITTGQALAGINVWVQQLNLCLTFAGGAIAARA